MGHVHWRAVLWSVAYVAIAALPLLGALGSDLPGRRFGVELGVGLGLVGFALLGLQFITTARFRWIAPRFGSDSILHFHRQAGILALVVVLAHPVVLISVERKYLAYFDPSVNFLRAVFLMAATIGLLLVVFLPMFGLRMGLSYEWWRLTHGLMAGGVMVVGLAHGLMVGHYISGVAMQAFWWVLTAMFLGLLVYPRVVKPWLARRTPYQVVSIDPKQGEVAVLTLKPQGHRGLRFTAGQYVWLTLRNSPFSLQQHPFSVASSADAPDTLELAIKASGDFTSHVEQAEAGRRAYLEGPYGAFTLDPRAEGAVFVMGGIGITPARSMLLTARHRGDQRPFVLLYGNVHRGDIAFHDELQQLSDQLNLKVVHVLSEPEPDWQGEEGFITREVLDRHLGEISQRDVQYFVCGPPPMMDLVERELRARGVPRRRLLSERFDFI